MFANNYISSVVENQLPEFIRSDHPNFVMLLKKYYEYLEQTDKTLQVNKSLYDYMDVDRTRADLLKYFKNKIIPDFPEETELSKEKLIKAARQFYAKKGTGEAFKFLFRVLYGQEIDVYFPKEDVLRASDGKWFLPQAIRLVFSDSLAEVYGGNVNVFAVTANTINANGINLLTTGITTNSYIQIGNEKRKVTEVDSSYLKVDVDFTNTGNTQIYDTKKLYKVSLSKYNDFDVRLLEQHKGVGETSRAACLIEKAIRTVDKDTGKEIVELYVSNLERVFTSGENLVVDYLDQNGDKQTFASKIVSLISNVYLYTNRLGVVQTGRKYRTGDPVVFAGGLSDSPEATKAVAIVNNVSTGSIEALSIVNGGYYFREFPNSLIQIQSDSGIGANIIVQAIWDDGGANSENFDFATDAIVYKRDILLNSTSGYDFDNASAQINLTIGAGNTTTKINLNTATYAASTVDDYYKSYVIKLVDGTGYTSSPNSAVIQSYNGATKLATLSTPLAVTPDGTSNVIIYANAATEIGRALSYDTITLGKIRSLYLVDGGSFFEQPPTLDVTSVYESDYSLDEDLMVIPSGQFTQYNKAAKTIRLNSSNSAYSLANGFYIGCRLFLDVGKTEHYARVVDYVVTNPGTSSNVKTVYLDRTFENNITPTNIVRFNLKMDFRRNVQGTGKIGKILINNPGIGYSNSDIIIFDGTGYGASANIVVDGSGIITAVNLLNRGEGYVAPPSIRIFAANGEVLSAGTGLDYTIILLSDGENLQAETSDIGRIQDFKIINRGFDYASTPNVSLKVIDVLTDNLPPATIVLAGDSVWQGEYATNANATFQAVVDEVYRTNPLDPYANAVIRIYNYNGTLNTGLPLHVTSFTGNVGVNVYSGNATISFNEVYEASERKYPLYYGDGTAKANAEFLDGIIKYSGFYLNTDGFISWDKKLQSNNYYHNFAYEIQSEKSLYDYRETIYRVGHPAGMQLRSRFRIKDIKNMEVNITNYTYASNNANVTNANTSYASNVFYGNLSNFLAHVNVGDMIVINTTETATEKQYVRVVTNVVDNNTLWLESPVGGLGDGRVRTVSGNANVFIYGNTYSVAESIEVGDNLTFNISGTEVRKEVINITGNVVELNAATGIFNSNGLYVKSPAYNVVDYTIITTHG